MLSLNGFTALPGTTAGSDVLFFGFVHVTMDKEAVTPWAFYACLVGVTLNHKMLAVS